MKKPERFRLNKDALASLHNVKSIEDKPTKEEETVASDIRLQELIALTEEKGIGFDGKDIAYVAQLSFISRTGACMLEQFPFLYDTKEDVDISKGAHEVIDYHRHCNTDIIGVVRPTVERIYKH